MAGKPPKRATNAVKSPSVYFIPLVDYFEKVRAPVAYSGYYPLKNARWLLASLLQQKLSGK
jgi:hypothetical protein